MPLTPRRAQTGGTFNVASLRPNTAPLTGLGGTVNFAVIPISDRILIIYQNTGTQLVEYEMVGGDPSTAVPTGNTLIPVGIPNQMCYSQTYNKIYYRNLFTGLVHQIDLVGEGLSGATVSPVTFNPNVTITSGWPLAISPDGANLYMSNFTGAKEVFRFQFGAPGDVSTLSLVSSTVFGFPYPSAFISIMMANNGMSLTFSGSGTTEPLSTAWLPAPNDINTPSPTTINYVGKQLSPAPYKTTGLALMNMNPDQTKLYISDLNQGIVAMLSVN